MEGRLAATRRWERPTKKKPSSAICSYVRCSVFCFNKTHTSMTFQWIPSAATAAATAAMAQHWMNVVMPFGADARCHIAYCTRMCVFIVPVAIQNAFNIIRLRVQCMFCWVGVPVHCSPTSFGYRPCLATTTAIAPHHRIWNAMFGACQKFPNNKFSYLISLFFFQLVAAAVQTNAVV